MSVLERGVFPIDSEEKGLKSGTVHFLEARPISLNLRNRTGEGKRGPTLCDKRVNNFVSNNFPPNFTFL